MTEFDGFGPDVQAWFTGLEAENSKRYFEARRDFFEASIRDQMEALLTELAERFGGEVRLFRQHRNLRFSRDKTPYKLSTSGVVHGSRLTGDPNVYASISARGLAAGGGYHTMARDQLERFRVGVADDDAGPQLAADVDSAEAAGLELWAERLATAPRGYPKDHDRIALLRHKGMSLGATRPFGHGIGRDDGLTFVADTWSAAAPVLRWLDERVGPSTEPVAAPLRRS